MRLSVIIPGYKNPDAWWARCVRSALAAIDADDEVICVDDGSPEKVELGDIGREWNVKVIRLEKNSGLAVARNEALKIAQGEYVTFIDSDDEVRPGTFRRCLEVMERSKSDICLYGVEVQWVKEGLLKRDVPDNRDYGKLSAVEVEDLSRRCLLNYAWNKVYRKAFLDEHGIRFDPDGMPCEDIIFNLDCICAGATWCSVDYVGYVYYRISGGRTILSSYKPTNHRGLALGAAAWKRYCETLPVEEAKRFADRCVLTEQQLAAMEWKNIWMPGTPYSLLGRWKWLKREGLGVQGFRRSEGSGVQGGEGSGVQKFRSSEGSESSGVQKFRSSEGSESSGVQGFGSFGKRVKVFVKTLVFTFLRRHFYLRPIRRWHIRRMYPEAREFRV